MSTPNPKKDLEQALSKIPSPLRNRLIKNYSTLKNRVLEGKHDTIGHQAGKLAEVLIRISQNILTNAYAPLRQSLSNFKNECEQLEQTPRASGPEGIRLVMPRALLFLYTIRNKRDFGHVGGEVDANEIDALTAIQVADWCMCEIIRVCHNLPLEDAQLLCNSIAERKLPVLWNILGRKRILDTSLGYKEQTLLLLYSEIEMGIPTEDLYGWTEHSHRTNFRKNILTKLHKSRLIEWDKETEMAIISPNGIDEVERNILPKLKIKSA